MYPTAERPIVNTIPEKNDPQPNPPFDGSGGLGAFVGPAVVVEAGLVVVGAAGVVVVLTVGVGRVVVVVVGVVGVVVLAGGA